MKNLETFFELSNYDSKNITNKGTGTIPQTALDKIEIEGVTLEFLQGLNVPVYKYRTQITIHGLFPALVNNYLGGYKNLFQNKNLSIGVKWQAVDFAKKSLIYNTIVSYLDGWHKTHNSTDFFIYTTSKMFHDKETYKILLEDAKLNISHINKGLFFGNCGVYLSQNFGGYFLVSYINIGAILETNVIPCIENITKVGIAAIEAKAAQKKKDADEREIIRKAEYTAAMEIKKAKQAPLMQAARQILTDAGYTMQEKTQLEDGKIYVRIDTDTETGCFNFTAYKYTKETRQKKWRYESTTSTSLDFDFSKKSWYDKGQQTVQITASGWVKQVAAVTETKIPVNTTIVNPAQAKKGTIVLVNYSDKAIALFGDTKAIKEQIKAIGGRFNPYLNNAGQKEAGWILPAAKKEAAMQLIN